MEIGNLNLEWLGHSGFLIKNSNTIYIDPFKIKENSEKADLIFITHSHYDHCSYDDIKKIVKQGTKIIMPADCQSKIARFDMPIDMEVITPGQEIEINDLRVFVIPAYNTDKPFHKKESGWVGYLLKIENTLIYHAGDTDAIPEMQKLTGHKQKGTEFISLLPVGGRFTMSPEEAVEAVKTIKPSLAIPMHYGSIVGSEEDADEFIDMCKEEGINAIKIKKE